MVDFLLAPVSDNRFLRKGATLPVTAGQTLGAGFETPGLGSLYVTQETIDLYERAAGTRTDPVDPVEPPPAEGELRLPEGFDARRRGPRTPKFAPDTLEANRSKVISADDLNKRYKDLGLKFEGPMSERGAALLAEKKRAEIIRKDVMARGGTLPALAGGILSMVTDPLEVATAFIPFLGPGVRAGMAARMGVMRGRVAAGAAEGFLGAAVTEPLYAGMSLQQQLDYKMTDALLNLGFGTALGGVGGAIGGGLARRRERIDAAAAQRATADAATRAELETRPPQGMVYTPRAADAPDPRLRQAMQDAEIDSFRTALAQMAQGRTVDLDGVRMTAPKREESLLEFIVARGGINDDAPTYRGEIAARGNPRVGIRRLATKKAKMDLDDVAELAAEAGFIRERDVRELTDAIDRELRGEKVYRTRDAGAGEAFDQMARDAGEAERTLEEFDAVRAELEADGITGLSLRDIHEVQAIMERDRIPAPDAFERLAIQEEAAVARASDPAGDYSGDINASREADAIDEFDVAGDVDDLTAMLDEMRAAGRLTPDDEKALADVEVLTRQAEATDRAAKAAAACLVR